LILVFVGVSNFIINNKNYKIFLWVFSGIILILLGVLSVISLKDKKVEKLAKLQTSPFATFLSGILVTLTNPMTIVGWLAVAGNFILIWSERFPESRKFSALTILLILAGVLIWFLPLTFLVSRFKKILHDKIKVFIVLISNIFLIVFGMAALYYAYINAFG
jgi:threonine/homoserine/homoserine lactone efflux protein